jgi:hypothetical protein
VNRQFAVLRLRTFASLAHAARMEDIVAGIEAAVPAIEELEGTAKLFLLLSNTLVRPLNAAQIEELKAAFKMEF